MKFLALYIPDPKTASIPPTQKDMEEMGKFAEEGVKAGTLLATGGILASTGVRVRLSGGEYRVIDGTGADAKEAICGFALLEHPSTEAAIEGCKQFLALAGEGETKILPVMEHRPEG